MGEKIDLDIIHTEVGQNTNVLSGISLPYRMRHIKGNRVICGRKRPAFVILQEQILYLQIGSLYGQLSQCSGTVAGSGIPARFLAPCMNFPDDFPDTVIVKPEGPVQIDIGNAILITVIGKRLMHKFSGLLPVLHGQGAAECGVAVPAERNPSVFPWSGGADLCAQIAVMLHTFADILLPA